MLPPSGLALHETEPPPFGSIRELWSGIYAVQIESAETIGFLARVCSYPHQTENIDNGKQLLAQRIEERLGEQFAALAWFIKANGLDAQRIEHIRDERFLRYTDNPPPGITVEIPNE